MGGRRYSQLRFIGSHGLLVRDSIVAFAFSIPKSSQPNYSRYWRFIDNLASHKLDALYELINHTHVLPPLLMSFASWAWESSWNVILVGIAMTRSQTLTAQQGPCAEFVLICAY